MQFLAMSAGNLLNSPAAKSVVGELATCLASLQKNISELKVL